MKRVTKPRPARITYDPAEHPYPPEPGQDEIGAMADRVMAGEIVIAPFENRVFVLLMSELSTRGWLGIVRSERDKRAAPFTIEVAKVSEI